MKKTQIILLYCILILLVLNTISCAKRDDTDRLLATVERIVEQHPDSALLLLDSISSFHNLNDKELNRFWLLQVQAKDKAYKDITKDTAIFQVRDYYMENGNKENAALAAFYCGRVRQEQENINKAARAYLDAKNLADKTNDYNLKGLIYGNLGILYREHSLYKEAIASGKNAVAMYDKSKNYKNKASALELIGSCFLLDKQIDSAFHYYGESLRLADDKHLPYLQFGVRQNLGVAYRQKGYYNEAKRLFDEAFSFSTDSVEQARLLLNMAQVYILEDKTDSVKFYLDKALELHVRDSRLMRSSYLLRSGVEEQNNNYRNALKFYKKYYNYTMEVYDNEENNKLLELQEKYDFEKIKNSNNQLTIKHQRIQLLFVFAVLGAGVIILIFYWKFTQNKKLLMDLEQKIDALQKMESNFSKASQTFRDELLDHFDIIRKTALIKTELSTNEQYSGQKLLRKFNKIVYGQDSPDWDKLYKVMNNLQDGLHDKIKERYPQLGEMEFRILCLTCEKFDDTEIAVILDKTVPMIRKMRNKIRESIKMPKYTHDFISFFKENLSITD